jgi:hypothetical protein
VNLNQLYGRKLLTSLAKFGLPSGEPQPKKRLASTRIASSIEIRQLERIQELADELADLLRASLARSLETVHAARAVPASPENLPVGVAHNVQQLYFAFGSEAQTSVEGLIVLPIPETSKHADDNLDVAPSVHFE